MSTCNPNLRRCDLAGTAVEGCALIGNAILQIRIFVKITEMGYRTDYFNVTDDLGNVLGTNVYKEDLCAGIWYYVPYNATEVILESLGKCKFFLHKDIIELSAPAIANLENTECSIVNTGTLWRHLTDTKLTNNFYGNIEPYVIEYPFMYQFHDEILQNVKDYTRAFKYLPIPDGVFNDNAKVEVDDQYFNKVIIYNGNQCTGMLKLVPKPNNNLSAYMQYPIYQADSKIITYTKTDSFYQYNTFWSVLRNRAVPMFVTSCESLSVDKVLNQTNMDYTTRSFKKETMRGKGVLIRHILDNTSDVHLVSQFIIAPSQISYK
jgi:hypothetical protein